MKDMKPLQVGTIVGNDGNHNIYLVMRTSSEDYPQVMNLSYPGWGKNWNHCLPALKVKLLPPGEKIIVELYNED
jgi:hypothetical protein